jgi:hypothetical protein
MSKSKSNTSGAKGPARSGGGVTSNKLVQVPVRYGSPTANKIDPGSASRIGHSVGNHTMSGDTRRPPEPLVTGTMKQVPLGNQVAGNVGKGGPGAGRIVHRSGSQAQHGPVAGSVQPQGRDILSDYSPKKG